jgi:glycosyltransferase involved in cell wall biosynthesis
MSSSTWPARPEDRAAPLIAEGLFSFQIGGSERVGVDTALEFKARGYRVACFAFYGSSGPFRDELESQGVECVDLDYSKRARLTRRVTYQYEFWRFLKRRGVAALHIHHATALTLCGIATRLAGLEHVVMTEHALFQLQEREPYRRQAIRDCRFASAVTGVHAGITEYFHSELAVPRDKLHVISNGVRASTPSPGARARLRTELGIAADAPVLLYVGRLEDVKDLGTLLRAVAVIPAPARAGLRVLLAGDGAMRAELEATRAQLDLAHTVTFLGARRDIADLLSCADIFAMSSRTEGLPMAIMEAMAAGLPCVATAVGGIPELLAEGTGFTAPTADPAGLAAHITRLIGDPALRAATGARARERVMALYGIDTVITRYLELLGLPPRWPARAQA